MKANSVFKKCLMFIFVCALLLMFAVPAMAKAPIAFSEKVTSNNNIVLYGIEISSESDVCGLSIELKYSENQVKLRDCVVGQILDGGIAKSNTNIGGKVVFTYISMMPLNEAGSIILLELESISEDNKNIDIECKITECIDKSCNEISYTYAKSVISNPKYVATDNNQGKNDVDITPSTGNDRVNTDNLTNIGSNSNETANAPTNTEPTTTGTTEGGSNKPTVSNDMVEDGDSSVTGNPTYESTEKIDEVNKETDNKVEQGKTDNQNTNLTIIISVSLVILLIFAYAIFGKKFLKRRNKSEKN